MNDRSTLSAGWSKIEILGKVAAGLLIPVVILIAGHWLTVQQEHVADARKNSDRVAVLLNHLASNSTRERILAIQTLRYHRESHEIPNEIVAALVTTAAIDNIEVATAAVAALGPSLQPRIEKHRLLLRLLGPMMQHLDRTARAFQQWKGENTVLVTPIIRAGNEAVRKLLLEHAALIPGELVDDAVELLKHYDAWFKEYERVRKAKDTPFVFVGPKGFPFPGKSEQRFRDYHRKLTEELDLHR